MYKCVCVCVPREMGEESVCERERVCLCVECVCVPREMEAGHSGREAIDLELGRPERERERERLKQVVLSSRNLNFIFKLRELEHQRNESFNI